MPLPSVFVIMGVSGSGKSTIGKLLSSRLQLPFFDADDFHPPANVDKMARGVPLSDADREPWLLELRNLLNTHKQDGCILACSALKERYRQLLSNHGKIPIQWVFLDGDFELIKARIDRRQNHFMSSRLLADQFNTLEIPDYGLTISINQNPEEIVNQILQHSNVLKPSLGLIGLGVMGSSLALNILEKGFPLSVYNRRTPDETHLIENFQKAASAFTNVQIFDQLPDFVNALPAPRTILLMIKAGTAVDSILDQLLPLLSPGDTILDGGNSHYRDTERRLNTCHQKGVHFLGMGISGGEKGARFGPSIMPGGDAAGFKQCKDVLTRIAAKDKNGNACCSFIGPGGAGHFVKMVHNGIEYAEMQLLAEVYNLLRGNLNYAEMATLLDEWNAGNDQNFLLEITVKILAKKEGDVPLLDLILDKAGNKGTGSWSSVAALELGSANNMMSEAVFARYISSFKQQRETLAANVPTSSEPTHPIDAAIIREAYSTARLLNHTQGFELLKTASKEYNWNLNLSEIARIWTNGCIIRSQLMETIAEWLSQTPSLFDVPQVPERLMHGEHALAEVLCAGISNRIPLPVCSAALNYWMGISSAQLPANLIQAQRDFFGAHRYQRIDDDSDTTYHTHWE